MVATISIAPTDAAIIMDTAHHTTHTLLGHYTTTAIPTMVQVLIVTIIPSSISSSESPLELHSSYSYSSSSTAATVGTSIRSNNSSKKLSVKMIQEWQSSWEAADPPTYPSLKKEKLPQHKMNISNQKWQVLLKTAIIILIKCLTLCTY